MSDQLTIRRLIDRITSGDIRIPAFQRDFVWEPDQVAFLLDSIYKGFPIGTVILWRTDSRLSTEKRLGLFSLPEPEKDYPVNYVLDGQQRITSLFSTFQSELTPVEDSWVQIYFDLSADENVQESLFVPLEDEDVDLARYFPVRTLFDSVTYRKATEALEDSTQRRIDTMQERFKEYILPNDTFDSSDRTKVAIVFERINRAGTELNVFELLTAWSWSDDFDLKEKFSDLQTEIADHNYSDLVDDKDLQLRICAGVITGKTSPDKILELQGEDIRMRFEEIQNGIIGAIDFLKRELGVAHYKMLPFPGILVPLSCYFATTKANGQKYTDKQREVICKWFWRCLFTRRFSSDVNERQSVDISEMLALKLDEDHVFRMPKIDNKIDFTQANFSAGNANSKTLILMLASMDPRSFLSGATLDTDKVLKKGSKHEFHHIFPKAYLRDEGYETRDANVLANICFLTRADNNEIKDRSPADYFADMNPDTQEEYLGRALIPIDVDDDDYWDFRDRRAEQLSGQALTLMGA